MPQQRVLAAWSAAVVAGWVVWVGLAQATLPDLILLDLIMPKLSGFEVLRHLKQEPRTAQIPVVVLSNLGQESDISQLLQAGAVAYHIKSNISLQDLVTHVKHILDEGQGQ